MYKLRYNESLESAMQNAFDELLDDVETQFECEGNIEEIEHESRDGFIPFTNGGFNITAYTSLGDINSRGTSVGTKEIQKSIDDAIEKGLQDALEAFCDQFTTELHDLFTPEQLAKPRNEKINYHDLYEIGEGKLAEELSETEQSYLNEGTTIFLQYRVQYYSADNSRNQTGEDEVCFISGVNLDFEYGRDKGLVTVYEETIKVSDLTEDLIKYHIKGMTKDI